MKKQVPNCMDAPGKIHWPGGGLLWSAILAMALTPLSAAAAATALYQQDAGYQQYQQAVEKIKAAERREAGRNDPVWKEAIGLLNKAVSVDPKPDREKSIQGRSQKYFPYFHLGVAFLRSGNLEGARQNFNQARLAGEITQERGFLGFGAASRDLQEYEAELQFHLGMRYFDNGEFDQVLERFARAKAGKLPTRFNRTLLDLERKARLSLKERDEQFDSLVQEVEAALAGRQYRAAADKLKEAARLSPTQFKKKGLDARKKQVDDHVDSLVAQGKEHLSSGRLSQARRFYSDARSIAPERSDASGPLGQIENREKNYQRAKAQGEQALADRNWAAAKAHFDRALEYHPEWSRRDQLAAKLDQVTSGLGFQELLDNCRRAHQRKNPAETVRACEAVLQNRDHPEAKKYRDQARSQLLFDQGRKLASRGRYEQANKSYEQALKVDAANQEARQAVDTSRSYQRASRGGKAEYRSWVQDRTLTDSLQEARKQLARAAGLDLRRFGRDGSRQMLDEINQVLELQVDTGTVRSAVRLIFAGQIETAIQTLEKARDEGSFWQSPPACLSGSGLCPIGLQ